MECEVAWRANANIDATIDQETKPGVTGRKIMQILNFT